MARDEHGMPLPDEESPLPWEKDGPWDVLDKSGLIVAYDCSTEKSRDFIVHAANNIIPAREIVRRLAEWHDEAAKPDGTLSFNLIEIAGSAEKLWAKMQSEASDE